MWTTSRLDFWSSRVLRRGRHRRHARRTTDRIWDRPPAHQGPASGRRTSAPNSEDIVKPCGLRSFPLGGGARLVPPGANTINDCDEVAYLVSGVLNRTSHRRVGYRSVT